MATNNRKLSDRPESGDVRRAPTRRQRSAAADRRFEQELGELFEEIADEPLPVELAELVRRLKTN